MYIDKYLYTCTHTYKCPTTLSDVLSHLLGYLTEII